MYKHIEPVSENFAKNFGFQLVAVRNDLVEKLK